MNQATSATAAFVAEKTTQWIHKYIIDILIYMYNIYIMYRENTYITIQTYIYNYIYTISHI